MKKSPPLVTRRAIVASPLPLLLLGGCDKSSKPSPRLPPASTPTKMSPFLEARLSAFPEGSDTGLLPLTSPSPKKTATYDAALMVLLLLRHDDPARALRVLRALSSLQSKDGSLPFSFRWPSPSQEERGYVRSGALSWCGYAATKWLARVTSHEARDEIVSMCEKLAAFLVRLQVEASSDRRDGLILAGRGLLQYTGTGKDTSEGLGAGVPEWASVEHNIDAYFFLRALGQITGKKTWIMAAKRIAAALQTRAWVLPTNQLATGIRARWTDDSLSLDCASWGGLFFLAVGDKQRARRSLQTAEDRYGSVDEKSGVKGHRPYAARRVIDDPELAARVAPVMALKNWDEVNAVWPEGSAGVALLAHRLGDSGRARAILRELAKLADKDGSYPLFTTDIPFEFDTGRSVASTAWVELTRAELDGHELVFASDERR